jgi:pilus assembly protein Flp/PilA
LHSPDVGPPQFAVRGYRALGYGTRRADLRDRIHEVLSFGLDTVRMKTMRRFLADETAATAIEYGLIAAGISLAIIAIINNLGTTLTTKFTSINAKIK